MIVWLSGPTPGMKNLTRMASNLENGKRRRVTRALCRLCNRELKFDQQGLQAWKQRSVKLKHVEVSKIAFLNTLRCFETSASSSSTTLPF